MSYGTIYISRFGRAYFDDFIDWKNANSLPYTKYQIKETDMRIKTATFTTSVHYDLTQGQYAILIKSKYHENFAGVILDIEYDEKTKLYTYQCQDFNRKYIEKFELAVGNAKLYNLLRYLLTFGEIKPWSKPTKKQLKAQKLHLSGLRALGKYDQSLYKGNLYKKNPFKQSISLIMRDKTYIEGIRDLVYNSLGHFDVYFNDRGVVQIQPLSKTDWENTGLILNDEYYDRKFKFSTTNAITGVNVTGSDDTIGDMFHFSQLRGLNLASFFGNVVTSTPNPANQTSAVQKTNNTNKNKNKNKNKTNNTINNKYGNPFNNKKKKAWINADGGSNGMKNALAKQLQKNGWKVHVGATYSNAHYSDYWNVSKDYSVYITIYNGFCAGTIREAYSSKIQNILRKKGVQLVVVFDTASWNNARGMKPYKYGDFSHYSVHRAWDDNFSSGDPSIKNVEKWFKKQKAVYCASPTASQVMKQFNAGGYFKYKGIKV